MLEYYFQEKYLRNNFHKRIIIHKHESIKYTHRTKAHLSHFNSPPDLSLFLPACAQVTINDTENDLQLQYRTLGHMGSQPQRKSLNHDVKCVRNDEIPPNTRKHKILSRGS